MSIEQTGQVRKTTFVENVDDFSNRVARTIGTDPQHRSFKRFGVLIAAMAFGTVGAEHFLGHDVGIIASGIATVLGGALAGDSYRIPSRIGEVKANVVIKTIESIKFIPDQNESAKERLQRELVGLELAKFLKQYPERDDLSKDVIRKILLGHLPVTDITPDTRRNLVVSKLGCSYEDQYREKYVSKNGREPDSKVVRAAVKDYVTKKVFEAQELAKDLRHPTREGFLRIADWGFGVLVISGLTVGIDKVASSVPGWATGFVDDGVIAASAWSRGSRRETGLGMGPSIQLIHSKDNSRTITMRQVARVNCQPRRVNRRS